MESAQPSTPSGGTSAAKAAADFKAMPMAEKIVAVAALLGLAGFLFGHGFSVLFKAWHATGLFLGTLGVLVLIGTKLFGVVLLAGGMHTKVVVLLALLPAVGMVIDAMNLSVWFFLMLIATFVMAYAAAKITSRESLLK